MNFTGKYIQRYILGLILFLILSFHLKGITDIENLSPRYEKVEIPFEYVNGLIEVNIRMNHIPLKFIYDTGAEHTILSKKEVAGLLGIKIIKEINVYGADFSKKISAFITSPVEIEVEGIFKKSEPIIILSEDIFSFNNLNSENSVHGILGASFFRHHYVKIDYLREILTIYPYDYKINYKGFKEINSKFNGHKPMIQSKIKINKSDSTIITNILVDTGSSVPVIFLKHLDRKFDLPAKTVKGQLGIGLGGDLEGYIGLIHHFQLNNFKFNGLICKFQDIDSSRVAEVSLHRDGIIGNEILKKFTILIDNISKKIYFKPNRNYKKKIKYDKSGITLFAAGRNLDKYYIKYIIPGSPADLAGLKPNDRIISLQYINAAFWSLNGVINLFKKKENKKIRIKVKRGNKKYLKTFLLKDMYR